MNKVICDMCGTSYSETASHCPICGYAKQEDAKVVFDPDASADGKHAYARGGRFSASNVRKTGSAKKSSNDEYDYDSDEPEKTRNGLNLALGITAIILFIMLVAVLISFGLKVSENSGRYDQIATTAATEKVNNGKCEAINVSIESVVLAAAGDKHLIQYSVVPKDTTDDVKFVSNAPQIASVDDNGSITAVSSGEAIITITCGSVNKTISVSCAFDSNKDEKWDLIGDEIKLTSKGATQDIYSSQSTVSKENIIWSSADELVATVDSGVVTAVSAGSTYVYAEYNGKKISCRIECVFETESESDQTAQNVDIDSLQMSNKKGDVTLVANGKSYEKSFELYLVDKNGVRVDVTWTPSKEGVVQIDGSKITGVKAGDYTVLKTTYEGKTFECTVRVRNN